MGDAGVRDHDARGSSDRFRRSRDLGRPHQTRFRCVTLLPFSIWCARRPRDANHVRLEAITPAWINQMLADFGRHFVAPYAGASTPPDEVALVRQFGRRDILACQRHRPRDLDA